MKLQPNTILVFKSNPYEGTIYDLNCVMTDKHRDFQEIYVTGPPKIRNIKEMEASISDNVKNTFFSNEVYYLSPVAENQMHLFIHRIGLVYGLCMLQEIEKHGYYLTMLCPKCGKTVKTSEIVVYGMDIKLSREYGCSNEVVKQHVHCENCHSKMVDDALEKEEG